MEMLFRHLDLAGCGILSISTGRNEMPDEAPSPTLDTGLTTNIVAAYVRHNQIGADQLPIVISTVHQALAGLGKSKAEIEMERTPAVPKFMSVEGCETVLDLANRIKLPRLVVQQLFDEATQQKRKNSCRPWALRAALACPFDTPSPRVPTYTERIATCNRSRLSGRDRPSAV